MVLFWDPRDWLAAPSLTGLGHLVPDGTHGTVCVRVACMIMSNLGANHDESVGAHYESAHKRGVQALGGKSFDRLA